MSPTLSTPAAASLIWGSRNKNWRTVLKLLLSYTASMLWHERPRYLSAVLAVTFCAALINIQWGMVLGIYSAMSIPVDHARAHVWVGAPNLLSVDMGRPISLGNLTRLASLPGVEHPEPYLLDYAVWVKRDGTKENCMVIGTRLVDGALGYVDALTAEQRALLTEPGTVIIDRADSKRLGISAAGETAEILGRRVRVVGLVTGLKGLFAPYVFCSLDTARQLLQLGPDQTTFLLARCQNPADGAAVVQALEGYEGLTAFTAEDLSFETRKHWILRTPGGLATGFLAALALLVGAVVTRQSLYTATVAALREYAVLRALGIPRRRIGLFVLGQSAGVGLIGVVLSLPLIYALSFLAAWVVGIPMIIRWWILLAVLAVTVVMALLSGLGTLRALRLMEPLTLLR